MGHCMSRPHACAVSCRGGEPVPFRAGPRLNGCILDCSLSARSVSRLQALGEPIMPAWRREQRLPALPLTQVQVADQAGGGPKMSTALRPPNANEFDMA